MTSKKATKQTYYVCWTSERFQQNVDAPMTGAYKNEYADNGLGNASWLVDLTSDQLAELPKTIYPRVIIQAARKRSGQKYPSIEFYDAYRE